MLTAVTMRLYSMYFILALLVLVSCSAIPKPGEEQHKTRSKETKLSDVDHDGTEDGHNEDYDHEAFLGKDDAKTFDDLSPEESKERLSIIVDKIDKDKNGSVTHQELQEWIHNVQKKYVMSDTERMWKDHDTKDDTLTFESYHKRTYGADLDDKSEDAAHNKEMVARDRRRWDAADQNKDGHLSKEEFAHFLHPEDAKHMQDVVVEETLEDIDKDHDGFISMEEYIKDMFPDSSEEKEPEWVKNERDQFTQHRDKDKDGKMSKAEIKEWIIPQDYDHSEAEARHLIFEADENKDGTLSKDEILEKYDLFVGSQATDFGEALVKHDEF